MDMKPRMIGALVSMMVIMGCAEVQGSPAGAGGTNGTGGTGGGLAVLTVLTTEPPNRAADVSPNTDLRVVFSEAVDPSSVTDTSFVLRESGGTTIEGTIGVERDTLTWSPRDALARLGVYEAVVTVEVRAESGATLPSEVSWTFTTQDRSWGAAELVETGSGDAAEPHVALGRSGNAVVVWQQDDGERNNIWANRFTNDAWGASQLLEDRNGNAVAARVALDLSGDGLAVWRQVQGNRTGIYASRFQDGAWRAPELVENPSDIPNRPVLTLDPSGNGVAVWELWSESAQAAYITAYRFAAGVWSQVIQIDKDQGIAVQPHVALDPSGNGIAVWDEGTVWANRFENGVWGTAQRIQSGADGSTTPQVALDAAGNGVAVWSARNGMVFNRFVSNTWHTSEVVETEGAVRASNPQVALDPSGDGVALWHQDDGTEDSIWASRFASGAWGDPELIESNSGDAHHPRLALDAAGNGVAVWLQVDGAHESLWANRFALGSWGEPVLVETGDDGDAQSPQVALNPEGSGIVVWAQDDGTEDNVWANRFE